MTRIYHLGKSKSAERDAVAFVGWFRHQFELLADGKVWEDLSKRSTDNVFSLDVRATDNEKPINWKLMQTRQDVSYHASKNANSNWTTGGEFISAIHRGLK